MNRSRPVHGGYADKVSEVPEGRRQTAAGVSASAAFLAKPVSVAALSLYGERTSQGWRGMVRASAVVTVLDSHQLRALANEARLLADVFDGSDDAFARTTDPQ